MPKVHFLNEYLTVDVPEGTTLLDAADEHGVQIYRGMWPNWNCSGLGMCGRCKVWVPSSDAVSRLTLSERFRRVKGEQRLACQVLILDDMEVRTRPIGPAFVDYKGAAAAVAPAAYEQAAAIKLEEAKEEARKKAEALKKKKEAAAKKKAQEEKEAGWDIDEESLKPPEKK